MSSMKKNALAVALVAGLGLAGAAAAYNYGTLKDPANCGYTDCTAPYSEQTANSDLLTAEPVAFQNLFAPNYSYTMREQLVWDINPPDNAVNFTNGFTARMTLRDGALFDTSYTPSVFNTNCAAGTDGIPGTADDVPAGARTTEDIYLDPALACTWNVAFDNYYDGGATISIRVTPKQGITNPQNPSSGMMLRYDNARVTSLNELAAGAARTGSSRGYIVHGDFWLVNPTNDAPFTGSLIRREVLEKVSGVAACASSEGADVDKYIDVADNWLENQLPKTRFSFDGKLGSAEDAVGGTNPFDAESQDSQVINLGQVTLGTNDTFGGGFSFAAGDAFRTTLTGDTGGWAAFDNDPAGPDSAFNDDLWLVNGTCVQGVPVARGEVIGNTVRFDYTGATVGAAFPGTIGVEGASVSMTVCGFVNTDTVINDQNISVATTFTRANVFGGSQMFAGEQCNLLPLRYNGSTMEIFTINPGSNTTQRSFIRLTNRSSTDGYVSLEGYDNNGTKGDSQVRVWVPAGASVQLDASELEQGSAAAIGAWGTGVGKWRAVVTAEFPGLVASSLTNSANARVLTNITDSDTRGEQYLRDYEEGHFANMPGERPSDFAQETTPDFRGNGFSDEEPGGPNGSDGPAGGTSEAPGNPGL